MVGSSRHRRPGAYPCHARVPHLVSATTCSRSSSMKTRRRRLRGFAFSIASGAIIVAATAIATLSAQAPAVTAAVVASQFYTVHNLVSDGADPADHTDPDLVNPWGIAASSTSPMWVADNETGVATIYNGEGVKQSTVVTIPPPPGGTAPSHPTGIVASSGNDFMIGNGVTSGPSRFMFATEDG